MKSVLHDYFRDDNIKTWLPMLGSVLGMFVGPIIQMLFTNEPSWFWALSIMSLFCTVVFLMLSLRYILFWHSIYKTLGSDSELMKTCAFLASMEMAKMTNERMSISEISVQYVINLPKTIDGVDFFPFSVCYDVKAIVNSRRGIKNIYYHLVTKSKHFDIKTKAHYQFEGCNEQKPQKVFKDSSLYTIELISDKEFLYGNIIHFTLRIDFDDKNGISNSGTQRLLFYPTNFSPGLYPNAKSNISFRFDNGSYNLYSAYFNDPIIHTYHNGLSEDIHKADSNFSKKHISLTNTDELNRQLPLAERKLFAIVIELKDSSI